MPTEQTPIKTDVPPSRKESLARPSSPTDSTTVIVPSPTKEETEDEAPVCAYRIPKKVEFNVSNVGSLKRKNCFPEIVEVKPELKEGVIAFSLTDTKHLCLYKRTLAKEKLGVSYKMTRIQESEIIRCWNS